MTTSDDVDRLVYVARFDRPLVWVHIAEPGGFPSEEVECLTRCGLMMSPGELWIEVVQRRGGDRLCVLCAKGAGLIENVEVSF